MSTIPHEYGRECLHLTKTTYSSHGRQMASLCSHLSYKHQHCNDTITSPLIRHCTFNPNPDAVIWIRHNIIGYPLIV